MSEDRLIYDDEFNFFEFFETLWNGKWKIIATTFVAALIGVVFSFVKPNTFVVTTPIQTAKSSVFLPYKSLNSLLEGKGFLDYKLNDESIFETFVVEFNDYDEMIDVLSENDFVKQSIKGLDEINKQKALIGFSKKFEIAPPSKKEQNWLLKFEWHDDYEGRSLFNDAIQKTLINTQKVSKNNVDELAKAIKTQNSFELQTLLNELNLVKLGEKERAKKRLQYLNEQAAIALELGIETQSHRDFQTSRNEVSIRFNNRLDEDEVSLIDEPFYQRGFKAINKEIALIKSRSEDEFLLMAKGNLEIKEKILLVEQDSSSSQLKTAANLIESDNVGNWVEFDFALAASKSNKKSVLYVALSIVLGGMIGVMYVLISNAIRKRKDELTKA